MSATEADATNGQAQVITREIEVPILDFTQPTSSITRKVGNTTVTVEFRRRTIQDYIARDKATKRESEMLARDEWEERGGDRPGNVALFNLIVERAERRDDQGTVLREYTQEECLKFSDREKDKFIKKLLRVKTEVLSMTSDGDADPMFDAAGEAVVRQRFGDPDNPDHVVDLRVSRPLQGVRDSYDACTRVRSKRTGDKPIYKVVTDLGKAYQIGKGLFLSMDGAIGNVNEIDPYCVLEYTAALMLELDKDEESF